MEAFFTPLIEKASPWAVNLVLFAVSSVIIIWVVSTIGVLKKNIFAQNLTEKFIDLQNKYNDISNNNIILNEKCKQFNTIQAGIKGAYAELKFTLFRFTQGEDVQQEAIMLLKSITDKIATDLKFHAGENHRCSIWVPSDDKNLEMLVASAGFPDYYRIQRLLRIDGSVAGRCFRTCSPVSISNVDTDRDFKHNPSSNHKYKSLICVPLLFGDSCLGIISVDAKEENSFAREDLEAIETYGEIATMVRFMQIAGYYQMQGGDSNDQIKS